LFPASNKAGTVSPITAPAMYQGHGLYSNSTIPSFEAGKIKLIFITSFVCVQRAAVVRYALSITL
jgi:hypothetical protein